MKKKILIIPVLLLSLLLTSCNTSLKEKRTDNISGIPPKESEYTEVPNYYEDTLSLLNYKGCIAFAVVNEYKVNNSIVRKETISYSYNKKTYKYEGTITTKVINTNLDTEEAYIETKKDAKAVSNITFIEFTHDNFTNFMETGRKVNANLSKNGINYLELNTSSAKIEITHSDYKVTNIKIEYTSNDGLDVAVSYTFRY